MLTADTITDEQIRELQRTQSPVTGNCAWVCAIALGEDNYDGNSPEATVARIKDARAHCAKILNTRTNYEAGTTAGARIKVEDRPGMPQFGVFLGLLLDDHGDTLAVVRLDQYGLMLKALHPSRVTPVTPDEEELHKP